uniref:Putative reeler n=1 Tax=Lutzomyia longipalpis TaxID=7200 RepID=A0A1B0CAY6_LUTLO
MFKLFFTVLVFNLCIVQNFASFAYGLPFRFYHGFFYRRCNFSFIYGICGVSPQPIDTLPYKLKASGYNYNPGTTITVTIDGDSFSGFYIRAFDEATREPLGSWEESTSLHAMDRCNAAIQADRKDKKSVELKWNSPPGRSGRVYFKNVIMKNNTTYWSNVILKGNKEENEKA